MITKFRRQRKFLFTHTNCVHETIIKFEQDKILYSGGKVVISWYISHNQ